MSELRIAKVKPRKPHRCSWCDQITEANEPAVYRVSVWDGFSAEYYHPECWDAIQKSDSRDLEDGWSPGEYGRGEVAPAYFSLKD